MVRPGRAGLAVACRSPTSQGRCTDKASAQGLSAHGVTTSHCAQCNCVPHSRHESRARASPATRHALHTRAPYAPRRCAGRARAGEGGAGWPQLRCAAAAGAVVTS
eukprot:scaffold4454_cov411-Prasinococcus_capsulatus_cf.AAC.2